MVKSDLTVIAGCATDILRLCHVATMLYVYLRLVTVRIKFVNMSKIELWQKRGYESVTVDFQNATILSTVSLQIVMNENRGLLGRRTVKVGQWH